MNCCALCGGEETLCLALNCIIKTDACLISTGKNEEKLRQEETTLSLILQLIQLVFMSDPKACLQDTNLHKGALGFTHI